MKPEEERHVEEEMIAETVIILGLMVGGGLVAVDGAYLGSHIAADMSRPEGQPSIFSKPWERPQSRYHHEEEESMVTCPHPCPFGLFGCPRTQRDPKAETRMCVDT